MKRLNKMLSVMTALLVVTAFAAGIVFGKTAAYRVIKVFELEGTASVTKEDKSTLKAYVSMNLENGDTVKVDDTSVMRLSLDNDKFVQLDPSTQIRLVAAGTLFKNKTSIELIDGGVLSEITEPLSKDSSYEVKTANATMSVRGTSFYVRTYKNKDGSTVTILDVFEGKVKINQTKNGKKINGTTFYVEPGESVAVKTTKKGQTYYYKRLPSPLNGVSSVPNGKDPTHKIEYGKLPNKVVSTLIESHETGLLLLEQNVIIELRYHQGTITEEYYYFITGGNQEPEETTTTTTTTYWTTYHIPQVTSGTSGAPTTTAPPTYTTAPTTTTETTTTEATVTEYKVEFLNNDGSVVYSATVEEGSAVDIPADPSYVMGSEWDHAISAGVTVDASKYFRFKGWGSDTAVDPDNITADATFEAVYEHTIPVRLSNSTYNISETKTIVAGDPVPQPSNTMVSSIAARMGITEYKTVTECDYSSTSDDVWLEFMSTNSSMEVEVTLKAAYTVNFVNCGSNIHTATVYGGESVSAPADPLYNGSYSTDYAQFTGWESDVNGSTLTSITADTTFTAQYTKTIPVLYTAAGTTVTKTASIAIGGTVADPDDTFIADAASALGYTNYTYTVTQNPTSTDEAAWNTLAENNEKLTVTVNFNTQFTVTFKHADGTAIGAPVTVNAGESVTAPADPLYNGSYSTDYAQFTGWKSSVTGSTVTNVTADTTFTAQYTKTIPVLYTATGTTVTKDASIAVGGTVADPDDTFIADAASALGYTKYTYTVTQNPASTDEATWNTLAENNEKLTVTVDFTKQFTVTFKHADGTNVTDPVYVDPGESVTAPADPLYNGSYSTDYAQFTGWESSVTTSSLTNITADTTFTAQYTKTIPVLYTAAGTTVTKDASIAVGGTVAAPDDTFIADAASALGYSKYTYTVTQNPASTDEAAWNTLAENNEKLTVTVDFTPQFTVTFKNNSGNTIGTPVIVNSGESVTAPEAPAYVLGSEWDGAISAGVTVDTSKYFRFDYWKSDNDSTESNIIADTVFTPVYVETIPVYFYNTDNSTAVEETIAVDVDSALPAPSQSFIDNLAAAMNITDLTGYAVTYNDEYPTNYDAWRIYMTSNSSLEIYVSLNIQYTVTFKHANGTQIGDPVKVSAGQSVTAPETPLYNGVYTEFYAPFIGWVSDVDGSDIDYITADTVFTAEHVKIVPVLYTIAGANPPIEEEKYLMVGTEVYDPTYEFIEKGIDALGVDIAECKIIITHSHDDISEETWEELASTNTKYIVTVEFAEAYTVRFLNNDGSVLDTQYVTPNGQAEEPNMPSFKCTWDNAFSGAVTAYTEFAGWESSDPSSSIDNITTDTDFTATYTTKAPVSYFYYDHTSGQTYNYTADPILVGEALPTDPPAEFIEQIRQAEGYDTTVQFILNNPGDVLTEDKWKDLLTGHDPFIGYVDIKT